MEMRSRPGSASLGICLVALLVAPIAAGCGQTGSPDAAARAAPPPVGGPLDAGLPVARPDEVGLASDGLARIVPAMQRHVDEGTVPGVMTMVARRGRVVHWAAVGMRDVARRDPLEPDDLFRIYSMTKPLASTAAMMLVDEGRLALEDPVARFIPEFADLTVLTATGDRVAPDRPMTVEHLLMHTSGLTYGFFGDTAVDRLFRESRVLEEATSLPDLTSRLAALPLQDHPGRRWNYSVSTDVLGRVVEVVSGRPFDAFVRTRILEPLGMEDTAFWVPAEKRTRFTAHYAPADDGLELVDSPTDGRYTRPPVWPSGGGGLVSTASDYVRFAQMLLQDGELDGVRILAADTVRTMRTNRLPRSLQPILLNRYLSPGYGFGLGFAVLTDAEATPEPDHAGVYRWAGAANTFFWVDPEIELIGLVWTQVNPFAAYEIEREFQTLVYDAVAPAS